MARARLVILFSLAFMSLGAIGALAGSDAKPKVNSQAGKKVEAAAPAKAVPAAPSAPIKITPEEKLQLTVIETKAVVAGLRNRITQLESSNVILSDQLIKFKAAAERQQQDELFKESAELEKTIIKSHDAGPDMAIDQVAGEIVSAQEKQNRDKARALAQQQGR